MRTQLLCSFLFFSAPAFAQNIIPLTAEAWDFGGREVDFTEHLGQEAMHLIAGDVRANGTNTATVNDLTFRNGTIEYDVAFTEQSFFTAAHFRYRDEENTEHIYLRSTGVGQPRLNTSIQYATVLAGANLWDLSGDYQSAADLRRGVYNHIKLVVHDRHLTETFTWPIIPSTALTSVGCPPGSASTRCTTIRATCVTGWRRGRGRTNC